MKNKQLVALLFLMAVADSTFAKDSPSVKLKHVTVNFDESKWTGKELATGRPENTSALLINSTKSVLVTVLDMTQQAEQSKSSDPPVERLAMASLMMDRKYANFFSVSKNNENYIIASKKMPGGWACLRGVIKKTADSQDFYSMSCAAMGRHFQLCVFMETTEAPKDLDLSRFRTLLLAMSATSK